MERIKEYPLVVGVNGPPGIGKGWFCNRLAPRFQSENGVRVMSHTLAIREEVFAKFGWTGEYEEFKHHVFEDGSNGRDRLIECGARRRREDPWYWSRRLTDSAMYREADIVFIDDVGFNNEVSWLIERSSQYICVVIADSEYTPGMYYKKKDGSFDIRQCVAHTGIPASIRADNSNAALAKFMHMVNKSDAGPWKTLNLARSLG